MEPVTAAPVSMLSAAAKARLAGNAAPRGPTAKRNTGGERHDLLCSVYVSNSTQQNMYPNYNTAL